MREDLVASLIAEFGTFRRANLYRYLYTALNNKVVASHLSADLIAWHKADIKYHEAFPSESGSGNTKGTVPNPTDSKDEK